MKNGIQKRSKKKNTAASAASATAGPPSAMKQTQSTMPLLLGMGSYDQQRDAVRPGGAAAKPGAEPGGAAAGGAAAAVPRSLFGDNSRELAEAKHLSITELGSYPTAQTLPAAVEKQLLDGLRSEGWEFANLAEAYEMIDADGVTLKQITVKETGDSYTHLEFYMGDTEVGYIYESGTMRQVAVISDQDVYMKAELKPHRLASPGPEMDPADRAHMNRKPR